MESQHAPLNESREKTKCSVNVLKTIIEKREKRSVHASTSEMFPSAIKSTIKKLSANNVVKDYLRTHKVPGGVLYTCSTISVYSTEYQKNQYIVLPGSTNSHLHFGKITELLTDNKFAYFVYKETTNHYCTKSDLFFIQEKK